MLHAKCFEAQYFTLSRKYEEFAIWANLQEHKNTKRLLNSLSLFVKDYVKLYANVQTSIDVGFNNLHAAVLDIPQLFELRHATEIVDGLTKHYEARINDPIVDDREEYDEGKLRLSFPRVRDAFVPQSYKVIGQAVKGRRLEDEESWIKLDRRDDLANFFLSYLSSPYSVLTPLVVLGHPGSGKSLLTTVLSAQLLSKHYTVIRVPLREVHSDASIVNQIEEQIARITSIRLDFMGRISASFKNNPPVVILDGYDELLQTSGKVFQNYLQDVQTFQTNEAEQGRAVRVIVTSRITLIDKATIPSGSTIVRLMEFDARQRRAWIDIWNDANAGYFLEAGIQRFELPDEDKPESSKSLGLAEQPLLLLMLALYDSEANALQKGRNLERTVLYDRLLRRFVARERGKSKEFRDLVRRDQVKHLEAEMQRLGVAAIGMYNRRKLHITLPELSEDLAFFDLN